MPPSCSVRRGSTSSPFAPLLGEASNKLWSEEVSPDDPAENATPRFLATGSRRFKSTQRRRSVPAARPRSRTLTSLFGDSRGEQGPSSHSREASTVFDRSQAVSHTDTGGESLPRRPGLVAGHLTSRRSQLPLDDSDSPVSPAPDRLTTHGSQSRVLVTAEASLTRRTLSHSISDGEHHDDEVVEHLDVIDPHVATVSHLSNATNSILIPPMPSLYRRRPIIDLSGPYGHTQQDVLEKGKRKDMDEIDLHVEHVLRKRDKIRRIAAGIWSFVKTPIGIITAIYGFCVVFWGAALVLFLAGWIPTSSDDRRGFWVEVSSQIVNALFTVTGVGLIPWRAVDTYRVIRIWHYKRLTRKLRRKAELPELYDEDDLPDPMFDTKYVHVLTDRQQKDLHHQQKEFAKSQTWYRPHGTASHRAFPIWTALLICLFVDGNSLFQVILCGCMWGLDRFQRPAWTTGTLIPASFVCGIIAAILIWRGGQKTKRTQAVEAMLRAALAHENGAGDLVAKVPCEPLATSQSAQIAATPTQEKPSHGIEDVDILVQNDVGFAPKTGQTSLEPVQPTPSCLLKQNEQV